jgi:hypothetical protein
VDVSVLWCASSSYGPVSDHVRGVSVVLCVSRYSKCCFVCVTVFSSDFATDNCVMMIVNSGLLGIF